jgi:hypothetical protein
MRKMCKISEMRNYAKSPNFKNRTKARRSNDHELLEGLVEMHGAAAVDEARKAAQAQLAVSTAQSSHARLRHARRRAIPAAPVSHSEALARCETRAWKSNLFRFKIYN